MFTSNQMRFCGVGIFVLGALAASACSSSPSSGGGGSTGSSSSSSGVGGGAASSSSSSVGGGATSSSNSGSSSSGAAVGCAASDAPPSASILAAGDGGLSLTGGITTYAGTTAPTATTDSTGTLTVTENAAASATADEYEGAVIYFSGNTTGTDCVNGSTYTGVQFTISGTVTGCTVVFTINDSEHSAVSSTDPKASGPAGSYPGTVPVTLTTTPTQVQVPFTGTGSPMGGSPSSPIDPTKLESISWQYVIPMGTGTCMSTLTIDDIAFYQ